MSKIIHIAPYYLPHVGGVETHLSKLNAELVKRGHEVTVLCRAHDSHLASEQIIDGVTVLRMSEEKVTTWIASIPVLGSLLFKLKTWTWIAQQGQLIASADVIHIHDVFWWIWPLYPLVYYKTFLTYHGWEGKYPVSIRAKIHRYYNWMSAKKTIHIGKFIQRFYWDKPTKVLYGGVDQKLINSPIKEYASESVPWHKQIQKVVFIGRLEQVNELEKTLTFLSLLKEINPKMKIIFVGDGSWRTKANALGEVTGFVADPSRYLTASDLVCANSYLSILEAQALGKVVCSFYSNPVKESYLKEYPGSKLMFMDSDPKEVIKKIEKLTTNQVNALVKLTKSFASTFTWSSLCDSYLDLWQITKKS